MRLACIAVVLTLWSASARADHGPLGLGLIVGEPTGLTLEVELSEHTAIDAAVGFDLFDNRDFYTHVEFLYFLDLVNGDQVSLAAYLGAGAYFTNHKDATFGARVPFGLSLEFSNAPIEIFLEIALRLRLAPAPVDPGVGAALGFRYYF